MMDNYYTTIFATRVGWRSSRFIHSANLCSYRKVKFTGSEEKKLKVIFLFSCLNLERVMSKVKYCYLLHVEEMLMV